MLLPFHRHHLLGAALSAAFGTTALLALSPPAMAQAQDGAASSQAVPVRVPAQPLAAALAELSRQTGMQVFAAGELVAGVGSRAVEGRYTPEHALQRMLAGTGLDAARTATGAFTVRRAPASAGPDAALPAVTITAQADTETATGPVGGYLARRAATATKTDTPLAETPQSVTVVTREQMLDQGAANMQDTLVYAAGVLSTPYGVDTRTDWMRVRGADPTVFLDGLRHAYGTRSTRADPVTLERLEVLRGPAGTLYGAGTVAGVVNMVSKRPQFEAQREVGVQYGSHDRRQVQADLTGGLDAEGTLAYRLVALSRKAGTQVDHVPDDRALIAPSLTWRPSAATSLTLLGLYQKDDSGVTAQFFPWQGTVLANPNGRLPSSRFIGEPTDYYDSERRTFGWLLEHQLNAGWTLRQNLRTASNENDTVYHYANFYGNGTTAGPGGWSIDPVGQRQLRRYWWSGNTRQRVAAVDTHVEGTLHTGDVRHQLLLGTDTTRKHEHSASTYGSSTIDAYAPVYGTPVAGTRRPNAATRERQTGLYAQDQITLGAWTVLAGLRHDRVAATAEGQPTDRASDTTKRLAVMYRLESGWTPYLSYAESFTPQSSINGRIFKPLQGTQWEAGVKYAPAGSAVAINAALFDLKETNRLRETGVDQYDQLGRVRNRGLELEAKATVARDLDLIANYNYVDLDAQLDGQPRHQASLWAKYRFSVGGVAGFSVGAGTRYVSAFTDTANGGQSPRVPGVALLDLVLAYDSTQWRYALNINNAADRYYVSACMTRGDCYIGARRNVVASATYRF